MSNSRYSWILFSYGQPCITVSLNRYISVDFLARCLLICCFHGCHKSMWETEDVVKKWSKDTTVSYIIRLHNYYWKRILVNPDHIVGSTIEEQLFTWNESAPAAVLDSLFLLISVTKALQASVHKSNTIILSHVVKDSKAILLSCFPRFVFFIQFWPFRTSAEAELGFYESPEFYESSVSFNRPGGERVRVCACVCWGGLLALERSRTQQVYCTTKTNTESNTAPPPAQLGNIFVCKRGSVRTCEVNSVVSGLQQVGGNLCVQLGAIFIFSSLPAWSSMGACTLLLP